jgi:hypothetical protein
LNQNRTLDPCFDAFSSREPASTSLENAIGRSDRAGARVAIAGSS